MVAKSQINVRLPDGVIKALKAKADEEGTSITALITSAIKRDLGLEESTSEAEMELEKRVDSLEQKISVQEASLRQFQEDMLSKIEFLKKNHL